MHLTYEDATMVAASDKFSKFLPPETLKMHSLAISVLDFHVKQSSNYISLHYETLFIVDDFLKTHIQIKHLYGYNHERVAKQS